jgi:hypothetical protein
MRKHVWVTLLSLALVIAGSYFTVALAQKPLERGSEEKAQKLLERGGEEEMQEQEDMDEELEQLDLALPFTVQQVSVECNGNCNDSDLRDVCDEGWTPIAVDCQNVQEPPQVISNPPIISCGGNNLCTRFPVLGVDDLHFYCDDISGWDANVYCAQAR